MRIFMSIEYMALKKSSEFTGVRPALEKKTIEVSSFVFMFLEIFTYSCTFFSQC